MDALLMHPRAKHTDLVSSGLSIGFIVSHKLKTLFEQFNFPPYLFYPTPILHKTKELNGYYLMHIISRYYEDYLDFVDYKASSFIMKGIAGNNPEPITLASKQHYLDKSKQLQDEASVKKNFRSISAKRIFFNTKFDKTIDLFIAPFGIDYYISQRLRDALIQDQISGCDINSTLRLVI